jgi:hypothetical protein
MKSGFEPLTYITVKHYGKDIYVPYKNKIEYYILNDDQSLEKKCDIVFDDEIMNFDMLNNGNLIIVGANNKKIAEVNLKSEIVKS